MEQNHPTVNQNSFIKPIPHGEEELATILNKIIDKICELEYINTLQIWDMIYEDCLICKNRK